MLKVSGACHSMVTVKAFRAKDQPKRKKRLLRKRLQASLPARHTVTSTATFASTASPRACNSLLVVPSAVVHGYPYGSRLLNRKRLWFCGQILHLGCCCIGTTQTSNNQGEGA